MNILVVDQARTGAWCVYDYENKVPIKYGAFAFALDPYTYAKVLVGVCDIVQSLMVEHSAVAVFIEDIQLRKNVDSFKKLAQLQGALVSMFERNEYLYEYVPPSRWQGCCGARGRTTKEVKAKMQSLSSLEGKKQSKILSLEFAKEQFGIETEDDNIADAICMGYYVVNNIEIVTANEEKG